MRERLIQEEWVDTPNGPWKVLVICCLLNRTSYRQVERMVSQFFEIWSGLMPFFYTMGYLDLRLASLAVPLGLGEKRRVTLKDMTYAYIHQYLEHLNDYSKYDIKALPECGQYALDARKLLVLRVVCKPSDNRLRAYAECSNLLGG